MVILGQFHYSCRAFFLAFTIEFLKILFRRYKLTSFYHQIVEKSK